VKTVSDKVVRHSLAISMRAKKLIMWDVLFYVKIWPKLSHPWKNVYLQSIFAPSASAVKPSEKKLKTRI